MGRKPLPTEVRRLQGNPQHRPLNENEPTPAKGYPACPTHISGEARNEWDRITDELDGMGLLTTADRTVIALYCQSWQRWIKAETKVMEMGEIVGAPKTKTPMQNPWLSIANKAHEQCHKMLVELGLTPSARSKIKIDKSDHAADDDDF
ncbi:MAG TPA: phage terminase small subunit P27 family [Tepidisphaeraceae bacterium]|jgi:P27 family predicted phage terminase small subunit|nr:phage terminase small subunit P27 family [Tepidisphaeraceae bacterium]